MSFWSELKRRRVVRVAISFAIVGLGVGEGAQIFLPNTGAPAWVLPVVLVLILLGFPVALVLAWAFDVTPEGIVRTETETGGVAAAEPARKIHDLLTTYIRVAAPMWRIEDHPRYLALRRRVWPDEFGEPVA